MATERRKDTEEFKREAVRLMETSGKAIAELARDLGINDNNSQWQPDQHGSGTEATAARAGGAAAGARYFKNIY